MAVKKLSDSVIRSLKHRPGRYEVWFPSSDGKGVLGVRVGPHSKTFVFSYRVDGKTKARRLTIGQYPKVTLADANAAVGAARKLLERGEDPGKEAVAERAAERKAETIKELCDDYLKRHAAAKRSKDEDQRILDREIIPHWGDRKVKEITRRDAVKLLDAIVDRGSPVMANRVLALLRVLFRFAVARGMLPSLADSPVAVMDRPHKEAPRERVLTADEIKTAWEAIDGAGMDDKLKRALKLMLVLGQRRGEVLGMHETELDRERKQWTIPGSRTKNGREHIVALTQFALDLIGDAPDKEKLAADTSLAWVFRSPRSKAPFEGRSASHGLRDLFHPRVPRKGSKADKRKPLAISSFTPHDLRRTMATTMRELGVSKTDVKLVLNHTDASVTGRHYDKYDGLAEKKRALALWSDWLEAILRGERPTNVVDLDSRRA